MVDTFSFRDAFFFYVEVCRDLYRLRLVCFFLLTVDADLFFLLVVVVEVRLGLRLGL